MRKRPKHLIDADTDRHTVSVCVVLLPFSLAVISFASAIAESLRAIISLPGMLSSALKHVGDAELLGGIQTPLTRPRKNLQFYLMLTCLKTRLLYKSFFFFF